MLHYPKLAQLNGSCMHFHNAERIVVLIDGPSLLATTRDLGIHVDFRKMLDVFRGRARLVRAVYYATVRTHDERQPMRPLLDWLEYNGYSLVTKAQSDYVDAQGYRQPRDDVRAEMCVDAMDLAPHIDHIVLVAGHSSFTHLCKALQRGGKRVTVISSIQSSPPMLSDDLRRQADQWVDLVELETLIGRLPIAEGEQTYAEPVSEAGAAAVTDRADRALVPNVETEMPTAAPRRSEAASQVRAPAVERRSRKRTET